MFCAAALVSPIGSSIALGRQPQAIKIGLSKNIVETARASGVPQFQTRDITGLVSYAVTGIPPQVPLRYARNGYEIFVEQTLAQFIRGKWVRYHEPEWTTLLTGRSSMLDETGRIAAELTTVDPAYKISPEDWRSAMRNGIIWRWSGDGVLATLTVNNDGNQSGKTDYNIELQFDRKRPGIPY